MVDAYKEKVCSALAKIRCSDIELVRGKVIEIAATESVERGFQTLVANRIRSAPVWDEQQKRYTGFLDINDLVKYAVFSSDTNNTTSNWNDVINCGIKAFQRASDGVNLKYLSGMHPFVPVSADATLLDVASNLSNKGRHRVPVINADRRCVNIISQSCLLNEIAKAQGKIVIKFTDSDAKQDTESISMQDIPAIVSSPVFSVRDSDSALSMFKTMEKYGLSGIAVVDAERRIISQTSGSDLKFWLRNHETLNQPAIDFLSKVRRNDAGANVKFPIVACKQTESLQHLIGRLAATKVHRIFLLNEHGVPTGVTSITDILRFLTTNV